MSALSCSGNSKTPFPQAGRPFILSLVLAATVFGKPRSQRKDECHFRHEQPPGRPLYAAVCPIRTQAQGWAAATAPPENNAPLCAASQGKGHGQFTSHSGGALPHLACGPGRNNPAHSTLNNQRVGLKSWGMVVLALSSSSNRWALQRALAAAPGHHGHLVQRHGCCRPRPRAALFQHPLHLGRGERPEPAGWEPGEG